MGPASREVKHASVSVRGGDGRRCLKRLFWKRRQKDWKTEVMDEHKETVSSEHSWAAARMNSRGF